MSMLTLPGTVMGILPIRDIEFCLRLPDVGQDFAADAEATCPSAAHDALGRRQDGRTQATEHAWDLAGARVHTQPGLADAFDAHHDRIPTTAARRVAQVDAQDAADAFATILK